MACWTGRVVGVGAALVAGAALVVGTAALFVGAAARVGVGCARGAVELVDRGVTGARAEGAVTRVSAVG
jgi:hypothetical protein